jgi:potassium-transporting ATPase KdpC subunit
VKAASSTPRVKFRHHLRPAIVSVISLTLLTGSIFPLVLFALGRLLYPSQAAGSLVTRNGAMIGSRLIVPREKDHRC